MDFEGNTSLGFLMHENWLYVGGSAEGPALYDMTWHDMIYLTAIGLTPGGSSKIHIYTQKYIEQHS